MVRDWPVCPVSMNTRSPRSLTRRSVVDNSGCLACKSFPITSTSIFDVSNDTPGPVGTST